MTENERRQFFRANCTAVLDIRPVDKNTVADGKPHQLFDEAEALGLLGNFHQLDKKGTQLAHRLRAGNTDSGQNSLLDYLDLINRKITCLSKTVIAQNPTLAAQTRQQIEFSENGLRFQSERSYYKDAAVAARIVFLPHYLSVVLFARVVRCVECTTAELAKEKRESPANRDQYHIALEFIALPESDRQIIAQHVMSAQLSAQRAAKKNAT